MHRLIDPATRLDIHEGSCALAMMAKAPRVGAVKTRLAPLLSIEEAAALSQCFIRDMAASIGSFSSDPRDVGVVAFAPAGDEAIFADLLPSRFYLLTQRGDDLGERLLHAAEDLFAVGFAAVCLINSDSPTLPPAILSEATARLRMAGNRVVLGGATDGGYYLLGLKRPQAHLFHQIAWSTPGVFAQTLARARQIGLAIDQLPPWYDVDDPASLRRLYDELLNPNTPAPDREASGHRAPFTARLLRRLAVENRAVDQLVGDRLPNVRLP